MALNNEWLYKLLESFPLKEEDIPRLEEELISICSEDIDGYIARRNSELRNKGCLIEERYKILAEELPHRLFCGPELTERQIKRRIYKS